MIGTVLQSCYTSSSRVHEQGFVVILCKPHPGHTSAWNSAPGMCLEHQILRADIQMHVCGSFGSHNLRKLCICSGEVCMVEAELLSGCLNQRIGQVT